MDRITRQMGLMVALPTVANGPPITFVVSVDHDYDPATSTPIIVLTLDNGQKRRVPDTAFDHTEPILTGTDPRTVQVRTELQKRLAAAQKVLAGKQPYRTFSTEMLNLLTRLRSRNTDWRAGTYPAHAWGGFSVDIFPGKWDEASLLKLFDDLNDSCEDDKADWVGKVAWRALFNPAAVRAKVNAKYGAGRVLFVDGHDDHIHLDVKPLTLQKDDVTGYGVNAAGRVQLR